MGWIGEPSELAVKSEVAAGRSSNAIDAGDEKDQLLEVAALERNFLDGLGFDGGAEIGGAGFDKRALAGGTAWRRSQATGNWCRTRTILY